MSYSHITYEDRITLSKMYRTGYSQSEIAKVLKKSKSTISRELKRNGGITKHKYNPRWAQKATKERRKEAHSRFFRIVGDVFLESFIESKMLLQWSPEQISGALDRQHSITLCKMTIYRYLYSHRRDLLPHLRTKDQWRKRRGTNVRVARRKEMQRKRYITSRPQEVELRQSLGHWEGDTVWSNGSKHALVTLVERKSGFLKATLIPNKEGLTVRKAIQKVFRTVPQNKRDTLTLDNGTEFSQWEQLENVTKTTIYFAHPYSSWERGTNENTNGLIRQYFPKKSSFATLTQQDVQMVVDRINERPRKRLNYQSPKEVFSCCTSE